MPLRIEIEEQGEGWFRQQLDRVDMLVDRDELTAAEQTLGFLREQALPRWLEMVEASAARLAAARDR